ncbi:sulfhydryl oxidase 2-like isoform X2 [Tigriopus californicus]|uniref:sulfhydryl oxidase 2-like isoform X2 n=1 Tax=Tigriopus californicus TaxID=6832 RepID=UPI0027DAB11A|nr:sulfhydryl oxidase 2-like isoform X2 [Tigriopus californicus]
MTRHPRIQQENHFISLRPLSMKMPFVLIGWLLMGNVELGLGNEAVSLYSSSDQVVELVDANMTNNIYNSRFLWVVEFYSHWCGHCQRFAPTWMMLADQFADWSGHVKISALNCAEQSDQCANFNIMGTPTVRIFPPTTAPPFQGVDVHLQNRSDLLYLRSTVMFHVAKSQMNQLFPYPLPNLQYSRARSYLELYSLIRQDPDRPTVCIVESADTPVLGLLVLQSLGPNTLEKMNIRRFHASSQETFQSYFTQITQFPAVVIHFGDLKRGESEQIFMPDKWSSIPVAQQVLGFIYQHLPQANRFEVLPISSTTSRSVSEELNNDDVVYATDLEKAIEYAITQEIANHPVLTEAHLTTIGWFLDVIIRYLPLRAEVKLFLTQLRDWPSQLQLKSISNDVYKDKVLELKRLFRPFQGTPDEWAGCRGSSPKYRGYPCSLWTLFHTLTVNAALRDQHKEPIEGPTLVARAMVSYIHYFFSCRHCAENFASKVRSIGALPSTPTGAILWLWKIHNMGNKKLAGDLTEDPAHPKIEWPSPALCPDCRAPPVSPSNEVGQGGTLWNLDKTADYLIKVYREENIIPNKFYASGLLRASSLNYVFLLAFHFLLQKKGFQW